MHFQDPFFYFEQTTRYLQVSPSRAGNWVLDFLEEEIPASITKVNNNKFTIKAEAFHGSLSCSIKVYLYQQETGCAVEFQRRSGDAIAFQGIFDKASAYLCEHTASQGSLLSTEKPGVTSAAVKGCSLLCAPTDMDVAVEDCLQVLLEMPRNTCPEQDEIASFILGMVEEDNAQKLTAWCEPEAFEVLLQLLATDRFNAAYPAAQLLARLADVPEAKSHLIKCINQGLLKAVLLRLWVQATGAVVWLSIANFVHSVVLKYAAHITGKEHQETAASIAAALHSEPLEISSVSSDRTACVGQRLRDALNALNGDFSKAHQKSLLHY